MKAVYVPPGRRGDWGSASIRDKGATSAGLWLSAEHADGRRSGSATRLPRVAERMRESHSSDGASESDSYARHIARRPSFRPAVSPNTSCRCSSQRSSLKALWSQATSVSTSRSARPEMSYAVDRIPMTS